MDVEWCAPAHTPANWTDRYDTMARIDAVVREARAAVAGAGGDSGDADRLMAHVLERNTAWLFAHGDEALDAAASARFHDLLARRVAGEPLAYLTGRRAFWTMELAVSPDTLIPRADTERLVELALARVPPADGVDVLDLGTGSGAIALAIAAERPRARVLATDASRAALAVARANAARLGLHRVTFAHGDWYDAIPVDARFDLIASNPPYIADDDPHLDRGDLRHEPRSALAAGSDGLDDIRTIVTGAGRRLKPGGWLLLEHGWAQGDPVRAHLEAAGFVHVSTERDLEDRDRVTLGQWPDRAARAAGTAR